MRYYCEECREKKGLARGFAAKLHVCEFCKHEVVCHCISGEGPTEIDIAKCDKTQCPEYNVHMPNYCAVLRDLDYCEEVKKLKKEISELRKGILDKVLVIFPTEKYFIRAMGGPTHGIFTSDGGDRPMITGIYENLDTIRNNMNAAHKVGMLDVVGQLGCDFKKEPSNEHDLIFERSSGYLGFRCTKCGDWFYKEAVDNNKQGECHE